MSYQGTFSNVIVAVDCGGTAHLISGILGEKDLHQLQIDETFFDGFCLEDNNFVGGPDNPGIYRCVIKLYYSPGTMELETDWEWHITSFEECKL